MVDIKAEEKDRTIGEKGPYLNRRAAFALSPGSIAFLSSPRASNEVDCWDALSGSKISTIKLPFSEGGSFISALTHHPYKPLLACSMYNSSDCCLALTRYENASSRTECSRKTQSDVGTLPADRIDREHQLERPEDGGTLRSILSWLDNLFRVAIHSPNHTDDYKQQRQIQITLDQLQLPLQLVSSDLNMYSSEEQSFEFHNKQTDYAEHAKASSDKHNSSDSNSQHTFTVEEPALVQRASKQNSDNSSEANDHTYSIEREESIDRHRSDNGPQ